MKFEKLLKSLGGKGVIYVNGDDKWLASSTAMAKIPEEMRGVVAEKTLPIPANIKTLVETDATNETANLYKAIMPVPNGSIKDCIRVYKTDTQDIQIGINNDDYGLITGKDFIEVHEKYGDNEIIPEALIIKEPSLDPDDDFETVGVIFPQMKQNYKY